MSDDPISFADLVGRVKPIKRKSNVPDFNRTRKIRHTRRIESVHERRVLNTAPSQNLAINLEGLSEQAFHAMRSQRVTPSRILDLHGFYVDEALRLLADTIGERNNRRLEYWVIVHGKGRNSPFYDRAPLKDAVIDFLLNHSAVKALTSIRDKDQRSGSVMIAIGRKLTF